MSESFPNQTLIGSIKGSFTVPSYQRGYKWTERQVEDLLNDMWEHSLNNTSENYCLQPLVISGNNIVDGQQRLTTIYIILKALDCQPNYTLRYATREGSESFLEDIAKCTALDESNPDYYFMSSAYLTVKNWLNQKSPEEKEALKNTCLERCYVILCTENSTKQDAIDVFTRLNTGKIPLTNSELVRAIFLKESNFKNTEAFKTQFRIANKWEEIEHNLQNDDFWYFLCSTKTEAARYSTRIELILDIIAQKPNYSDKNEFFTFDYYFNQLKSTQQDAPADKVEELWNNINEYFVILKNWFEDTKQYNYIGFLITQGVKLKDIFKKNTDCGAQDFEKRLTDEIKENFKNNTNISSLQYGRDSSAIIRILLLFNIQSCINQNIRFSFKDYKKSQLSLEHIHAQASQEMSPKEMKRWIEYHRVYLKDVPSDPELESLTSSKDIKKLFTECYGRVHNQSDIENIDSLSNLTLLDGSSNSALSNSIFPVKKRKLNEMSLDRYILPCTDDIFKKNYSETDTGSIAWTQEDADCYLRKVTEILRIFIPIQKED